MKKKLTDEQIMKIETWAAQKKNNNSLTDKEKEAIEIIEDIKKSNWADYRLNNTHTISKEQTQAQLNRLASKPV